MNSELELKETFSTGSRCFWPIREGSVIRVTLCVNAVESADDGSTPSPKNDEGYEPPKPNTPKTESTLESTAVPQSSEQYLQDTSGMESSSVSGDGSFQENQSGSSPETTTLSSDRGATTISATGNPTAQTTGNEYVAMLVNDHFLMHGTIVLHIAAC